MTHTDQLPAAAVPAEPGEVGEWIQRNAITLAALAMIALQLWWKADLLGHFYFRQDDFQYFDRALASPLSWNYLMTVNAGHLIPGDFGLVWVLARLSVYDWTLTTIITLVLLAATSLALLRLLRTLFGNRPAILILLAIPMFTTLTMSGTSFWSETIIYLPLQLAIFMAADAHIKYVRTSRFRHAALAAAWLAFGLLFGSQDLVFIPLLFALTSGFLLSGPWLPAARQALRTYWRAWVLYCGLAVVYLTVFVIQLQASTQHPTKPGLFSGVLTFASTMLRDSFIPTALGGPWRWYSIGDYAFALQAPVLRQISWLVAAAIIIASIWYRRRAWRAWAILAGWLVIADMLPVVIGRLGLEVAGPIFLGLDLRYLADSVSVLVICVGLAFWPVTGEEAAHRASLPSARVRYATTGILLLCVLVGSIWSTNAYVRDTSAGAAATRSYIATATVAVTRVPVGTEIVSGPVPATVMDTKFFGSAADTAVVIGPLIPPAARLRWTQSPEGQVANLMVFDDLGRLRPAVVLGASTLNPPARKGCWPVRAGRSTLIPLSTDLYNWAWTAEVQYSGPATTLQLQFGEGVRDVTLPSGTHNFYIPITGNGRAVRLQSLSAGPSVCVSSVKVGSLQVEPDSYPTPFFAIP